MPVTLLALAALLLALHPARLALAQEPTPTDDEVNRIAHQLYCPVCENTPLDVCPTEACRQWRDLIRQQLSDGWSEQQIQQYFVEQYGARVLAVPPRTGLNWVIYVLPPLIILGGVILLIRSFRSWKEPVAAPAQPSSTAAPDEYIQRMEDELKKRG